ncbi:MAG: aconitate hydratase B, partial [Epsilonproteobacteria bacterium]|nr:aconitate hydratase B [Campylobacterota bacterium]
MDYLKAYNEHVLQRSKLGVPPLPLDAQQTAKVVESLKKGEGDQKVLLKLLENRVNPGVDDAAYVKASFLNAIVKKEVECVSITPLKAVEILGTMMGGYNVQPLVDALSSDDKFVATGACDALKKTILVYSSFNDVEKLAKTNNYAKEVLESWAKAEWFTSKKTIPQKITVAVLKVPGETNTDDLSPASEAFTRSDIPLHAQCMLDKRIPDALEKIREFQAKGYEVAYVGDVVGTGSSRKSGINSVQWWLGREIPHVPNKKTGGLVLGNTIAPIFFNTAEDSGALPVEVDVSALETGDIIDVYPYDGKIEKNGSVVATFKLNPNTLA